MSLAEELIGFTLDAATAELIRRQETIDRLTTELAAKDKLLETERMRLAACGVVAMSNTPESATKAREMHPDYRSASLEDVIAAVDREMALHTELAATKKDAERLRKIATLIGVIYAYGDFKAETYNERKLEKLLRENGTFWESPLEYSKSSEFAAAIAAQQEPNNVD